MKKIIKECPIIIGIGAVAIVLTVAGFLFKDTVYAEYRGADGSSETPLIAVALNGMRDGVFPWTSVDADVDVMLADNAGEGQDVISETGSSVETIAGASAEEKADGAKASEGKTDADKTDAANGKMSGDGKDVAGADGKAAEDSKALAESDEKDKSSEEVMAAERQAGQENAAGASGQEQAAGEVQQAAAGDTTGKTQQAASGTQQDAQQASQEVPQETAQEIPVTASEPQPVPVVEDRVYNFTSVTDDYFCDALFIGDSRTVGLSEYCAPLDQRATFYSKISMSIYDVMKKKFINSPNGKIGLEQALSENSFGKIYIMLGLNEIGTGSDDYFRNAYKGVVDRIRELQPGAIIYIQGIMHVTANKSNSNQYFNNQRINSRNAAISTLADQKYVFYIDMNPAVDDENGDLMQDLSFDDVHLKASSYQRWYEYLLQHAIVR